MSLDQISKKRARRFVLLTVFVYSVGFGIIMPVLPELIQKLAHVGLAEASRIGAWIGASYAIFQFLMGPMIGNLGDRFGRRPVFLLSLAAFGFDFLLMGQAPAIIWLFIGRSVAGGLGAIFGPANAAMADMSSAEERAASFGQVGAAFGYGFIAGPVLGGFLADYGTQVPFLVASALAFSVCLYGYFVFPETMPEKSQRSFEWRRANPLGAIVSLGKVKGVLPIAVIYFLWLLATDIYPATWSYFAPAQFGWDSQMVGASLTIVGISMAIVQSFVIGKLVSRFGERTIAMAAASFGATMFFTIAFLSNGAVVLVLLLLNGISGMAMPAINAMMSRRAPPEQQGELQGLNGSLSALALLMAQVIYNNVLAYFIGKTSPIFFPGAPFIIACAIAVTALIVLLLLPRHKTPNE
jgi:DHA1 family tetracycline resistance protein-like MFS transporter